MLVATPNSSVLGQDGESGKEFERIKSPQMPSEYSEIAWVASETILQNHLSPPTRQQMYLSMEVTLRNLARQVLTPVTSREISKLHSQEELTERIEKAWSDHRMKIDRSDSEVFVDLMNGLLSSANGRPTFLTKKELRVQKQLAANRYVGIGIALQMLPTGYSQITKTFPRGPADKAGAKDNDLIIQVDGVNCKDKTIREVVDLLRGAKDTKVNVHLQQPTADEIRKFDMVRGEVPMTTVHGVKLLDSKNLIWDFEFKNAKASQTAYVRISNIAGSTPAELRDVSQQILQANLNSKSDESESDDSTDGKDSTNNTKFKRVVIDMREANATDLHHVVLIGDQLMDGGVIGHTRRNDKNETFTSREQRRFGDLELVVLVSPSSPDLVKWLGHGLSFQKKATVKGLTREGNGYLHTTVELPSGMGAISNVATDYLFGPDNRWVHTAIRDLRIVHDARNSNRYEEGGTLNKDDHLLKSLFGEEIN